MHLYRRVLVPGNESADGETPTEVRVVALPCGGYVLHYTSEAEGTVILAHDWNRDVLITMAARLPLESFVDAAKSIDAHSRALMVTKHMVIHDGVRR